MRVTVVKVVSALTLVGLTVGPAVVAASAASGNNSQSSTSACPTGTTAHQGGAYTQDPKHLTPVRLADSGQCYTNIKVTGNFASSKTWWDLKQCCNGSGVLVTSGPTALTMLRTNNVAVDGVRIRNAATTTIDRAWETDTRDDCIDNITHGDLYISNSMFDGCHTGISWRSSGNKNKKSFTLNIHDSLFYIKPMTDHGSGGSCKQWVQNGKDNGTMFKMDAVQSGVTMKNVLIRMDLANYQCVDKWPAGSYDNVWLLWNNSQPYPGTLPAGVQVTNDVRVWDYYKSYFINHYSDGTGSDPTPEPSTGPTEPPSPSPSPSPSEQPTGNPSPQPSDNPTGKPVPGQGGGNGGNAPSSCPSRTVTMSAGSSYSDNASNTTYDGRGRSYTETENNLTPVVLNGSNNCLIGATVGSSIDRGIKWWQMKQCCNGAGVTLNGSAYLQDVRIDNAGVDGIRIWNSSGVTMNGVYESYTRDDCISDITHGDLVIRDSLFDGCHTGISWRSDGNKNTSKFTIDIQDTMFYVQPEPGSTSGGSCTQYVVGGKANGPMWKMDSMQSGVNLKNVIIRQDLGNHECKDVWPSGTYNNVTFVWTGSGAYPGTLPNGVTLTRDVSVWNNAKSAWLARHGY